MQHKRKVPMTFVPPISADPPIAVGPTRVSSKLLPAPKRLFVLGKAGNSSPGLQHGQRLCEQLVEIERISIPQCRSASRDSLNLEPPRLSWRLFGVSQTGMVC